MYIIAPWEAGSQAQEGQQRHQMLQRSQWEISGRRVSRRKRTEAEASQWEES